MMKIVALVSGGKDSLYAAFLAKKQDYDIIYLASIHTKREDSYMYHTVNIGLTFLQAQASGIQLVTKESFGEKERELDDLKILLQNLNVEGVVCGAIASNYQKSRIEKICKELNLKLIAPLWHKDPEKILKDMLKNKFNIIITSVSADGFDKSWLGRKIDKKCINDLKELNRKYGVHLSGEGGEYDTTVLDCPLFSKKIEITDSEIVWKNKSGLFNIKDAKLI